LAADRTAHCATPGRAVSAGYRGTEFQWPADGGLGPLSYVAQRGIYLHPTYAVTPGRVPLGVLDAWRWAREPKRHARRAQRREGESALDRRLGAGGGNCIEHAAHAVALLSYADSGENHMRRKDVSRNSVSPAAVANLKTCSSQSRAWVSLTASRSANRPMLGCFWTRSLSRPTPVVSSPLFLRRSSRLASA